LRAERLFADPAAMGRSQDENNHFNVPDFANDAVIANPISPQPSHVRIAANPLQYRLVP
jgi:hypothetical protein